MHTEELSGRVIASGRDIWRVSTPSGELTARIAGSMRYHALSPADLPVTGDYVVLHEQTIVRVMPRHSKLSRRAAGTRGEEQVLAANVDVAFIVCGLDRDFNERRLERYLVLAREGGVTPVIVLNKCDLREAPPLSLRAEVIATSTFIETGLDALTRMLAPGRTYALLGSSGAGKSSILNRLLSGEVRRTSEVREHDSRGRHTTTARELLQLPCGAFMIDTPGLREIQLRAEETTIADTFEEITALAAGCRFSDCHHNGEPGCAVAAALESGDLDEGRWRNYRKLTFESRQFDKKSIRKLSRQMRRNKEMW